MTTFSGGTIDGSILPTQTGKDLGSAAQRWDLFAQDINVSGTISLGNIRFASGFAGANAGAKISAAIADLPSDGGIVFADFKGAQAISSTITVNKPVVIFCDFETLTTSVAPAFDFVQAGSNSRLIGLGIGSTTSGGTRIVGANGTLTPLVRIAGSAANARAVKVTLQDLTIEGVYNATQVGLNVNYATDIELRHVQFAELGQAEDIDDVYGIEHHEVNYFHCGSGNTAATATVRGENRSNPGVTANNFMWYDSVWQGDESGVTNKDGIAIYLGAAIDLAVIASCHFDYDSATVAMDKRVIVIEKTSDVHIWNNWISASNASGPAAVIEFTGTGGDKADNFITGGNHIGHPATVPAYRVDFGANSQIAMGDVITGGGTGTQITLTANANSINVGPYTSGATPTTPVSDSGTANVYQVNATNAAYWQMNAARLGTAPFAATGLLALPNAGNIVWRNAANGADYFLGLNSGDQLQTSAAIRTNVSIGVNRAALSNGLAMPNAIPIYFRNFANSADFPVSVNASDQLTIGALPLVSTVVTGTAPLVVASATKNVNLNADLLDDLNSASAATASTIAARDANADLTTRDYLGRRLKGTGGTSLVAGDFVLSAGWGAGSTVTAVTGTDMAWNITVTAAGVPGANPTVTLTYKDGSWTLVPICGSKWNGGTGAAAFVQDAPTATTDVITFLAVPVAGLTYVLSGYTIGR